MNNPDTYTTDTYQLTYEMVDHGVIITQRFIGAEAYRGTRRIKLTPEETICLSCFMAEDRQANGGYSGIDDWIGIS